MKPNETSNRKEILGYATGQINTFSYDSFVGEASVNVALYLYVICYFFSWKYTNAQTVLTGVKSPLPNFSEI